MKWDIPTWLTSILVAALSAAVAALVRISVEWVTSRFGPTARMKRADKVERASQPAPAQPTTPLIAPLTVPLDLQLHAREVELVRVRQDLVDAQRALVRLRLELLQEHERVQFEAAARPVYVEQVREAQLALMALRASFDQAAVESARTAGELTAQREHNLRLVAEMEQLRKEGGSAPPARRPEPVDPRFAVERVAGLPEIDLARVQARKPAKKRA